MPVGGTIESKTSEATTPIRLRLKAWWHGMPVEAFCANEASAAAAREPEGLPEIPKQRWVRERIEVAQQVWGEGMCGPGDEDFLHHLISPLGLDPAMNVVNLGAGLGGADRYMVEKFGVWVTGLEADTDLVTESNDLSSRAGMNKKAPVELYNPDEHIFKPKSIDCILSMNNLYGVKEKTRLLEEVSRGLKAGGQFLLTDFLLADGVKTDDLSDWARRAPVKPHLWQLADFEQKFADLRLDLRVKEDITSTFCSIIAKSWADVVPTVEKERGSRLYSAILVDELEIWSRLSEALESGKLRIYRFHAIKGKADKMLSDW